MSWTKKYWDNVSDFYWWPSYIGLKSINQKHWKKTKDTVSIPIEMTNPHGPLYRREKSGDEYWSYIKRQEETFNQIFNIMLSILPGDIISEIFGTFVNLKSTHDYVLKGNEIKNEYDWIAGGNVTTPDSFLVSPKSIYAMEIKFNAQTSANQLAKYVALMAGEELLNGKKECLDLLYIYPDINHVKFLKEAGLDSSLSIQHFDYLRQSFQNKKLTEFYQNEEDAIKSALERINVSFASWQQISDRLNEYIASIGATGGDRVLKNLLSGVVEEIALHPDSGVNN